MRPLVRAVEDLDVEALLRRHAAELVDVARQRRDHEDAGVLRVARVERDAVAEHAAVLVAERGVARLADLHRRHVVDEAVVDRLERVLAAEDPLLQGRLVPDADRLADGVVLVGAILVLGAAAGGTVETIFGIVAVAFGAANVVGGFVVTDRMLQMFKRRPEPGEEGKE